MLLRILKPRQTNQAKQRTNPRRLPKQGKTEEDAKQQAHPSPSHYLRAQRSTTKEEHRQYVPLKLRAILHQKVVS